MLEVPIQSTPSQLVKSVLDGQNVQIALYQKDVGLFCDVNSDGVDIVTGVICRNAVPIVCREYAGFIGNLVFFDTQGSQDPEYSGLGSRYTLAYLTADENASIA